MKMYSFASGAPRRRSPRQPRLAIIGAALLAVALCAVWITLRSHRPVARVVAHAATSLSAAGTAMAQAPLRIERQTLAAIDGVRPLTARSQAELDRRIAHDIEKPGMRPLELAVVVIVALTLAATSIFHLARFFDRRRASELRRVKLALADQLARANAEQALSRTEGQLRAVFESSPAAIAIFDSELHVTQANRAFCELRERHADAEAALIPKVRSVLTNGTAPNTTVIQLSPTRENRQYFTMSLAGVFAEERCVSVIVTLSDVTGIKDSEARFREDSMRDTLTGLSNRKGLEDRYSTLSADERDRLAIVFIDLDGFKPINDQFGHAAGDSVLIAIGERLRGIVALGDVVARLGGDEFAVLVRDVGDEATAVTIAKRILASINVPISIASGVVSVSASLGVALDRARLQRDIAPVLARADAAMYRAKVNHTGFELADPMPDALSSAN